MLSTQNIQFASMVRDLRFRLGLTQEQLAAELGVTFVSVNRWENNKVQQSAAITNGNATDAIDVTRNGRSQLLCIVLKRCL
jgi:transcriptional regulator with XRE-family HTH domain